MASSDDLIAAGRVLPEDYPQKTRQRIRDFFGLTEKELSASFAMMRRPYDDPQRALPLCPKSTNDG